MSIRAELLRLGLRCLKRRGADAPDVAAIRRRLELVKYIIPGPPRGTTVTRPIAGGVPAVHVVRRRSRDDWHMLYLHGGAYVYGSPSHYRDFIWRVADATTCRVLCVDYRLAPEHPFPAAVDDAVSAYRWLVANGADPRRTAIMGDSAGGGLVFATLLKLRDRGEALPAAAIALSPWTDLALSGESLRSNAKADPMLNAAQADAFVEFYLAGADPRNPHASPLYGDPRGLPPSLILVGGDEILRDDAVRMAERLHAAGCTAELEIWPRMPHIWPLFARILPEGARAIERIGAFVRSRLATH
jgi:acetyl esterase/lipase